MPIKPGKNLDKSNNSRTIHHLKTQQIDWSTVLIPFVHLGDTDGFHKAFDWNCMNSCRTHGESNFRRQINNIWFIWIDLIFNSARWCLCKLCFFHLSFEESSSNLTTYFQLAGSIWMVGHWNSYYFCLGIRYFSTSRRMESPTCCWTTMRFEGPSGQQVMIRLRIESLNKSRVEWF